MSAKCLEANNKAAALKAGRGYTAPASIKVEVPGPVKHKYSYINASGGVTVTSKNKKGIIQ